uniref:Uncharacterized protein n=1 Tax=Arundo donax TaxID=35708 RepID=A0A0A9C0S4_ARUDO
MDERSGPRNVGCSSITTKTAQRLFRCHELILASCYQC